MYSATICEQARRSRDTRFDGKFYTAVLTTGIFCRPICPARPPKEENVRYYQMAEQALHAGYRPCKRCLPELAPNALMPKNISSIIDQFDLSQDTLDSLAEKHHISKRHLQRLFIEHCGLPPSQFFHQQRLLLAQRLLSSSLSITDICFASGFNSTRRFNEAFKTAFRSSPSELRKKQKTSNEQFATVLLPYRPPFDWPLMLSFLKTRQMSNTERVESNRYIRSVAIDECSGWITVEHHEKKHALTLKAHLSDYRYLHQIIKRVRKIFDLDADMQVIHEHLAATAKLEQVISTYPGLRLPGCWDIFEFSIRAILGQQVSVKAATTLAERIAEHYGKVLPENIHDLTRSFPTANDLADVSFEGLGLTQARINTLKIWVEYYLQHPEIFESYRSVSVLEKELTKLKGIGPWTVNYIAMRGLSDPDAFPSADLGIIKALTIKGEKPKIKEITEQSKQWQPWRAYAAIYLWHSLALNN